MLEEARRYLNIPKEVLDKGIINTRKSKDILLAS